MLDSRGWTCSHLTVKRMFTDVCDKCGRPPPCLLPQSGSCFQLLLLLSWIIIIIWDMSRTNSASALNHKKNIFKRRRKTKVKHTDWLKTGLDFWVIKHQMHYSVMTYFWRSPRWVSGLDSDAEAETWKPHDKTAAAEVRGQAPSTIRHYLIRHLVTLIFPYPDSPPQPISASYEPLCRPITGQRDLWDRINGKQELKASAGQRSQKQTVRFPPWCSTSVLLVSCQGYTVKTVRLLYKIMATRTDGKCI